MQLPSVRTLKYYVDANLESAGDSHSRILESRKQYMSDVYSVLSPDYRKRQTTYVLQVLWRDLTSEFDVIGPHYTSDSQFPHQALCRLLFDSIHQFHVCGFETVAVDCDGAAPNMTMVKEMSGAARKAYRCAIINYVSIG